MPITIRKAARALPAMALFAASTTLAQAQFGGDGQAYVNVGIDAVEFDAYALSGKVGYNINEYFGVEGQAGFGIIDDSFDDEEFGIEADAGVSYLVGIFGTLRTPVADSAELFARAGYHFTGISVEIDDGFDDFSDTVDFDGFAIGVGGQYFFGPAQLNGVRAEYTYLDIDNAGSADGDLFSLSYVRRF